MHRHIPYALVKIYLSGTDTLVKKVVSDELGRFYILVPPGTYTITVEEKLADSSYHKIMEIPSIELRKGVIGKDLVAA